VNSTYTAGSDQQVTTPPLLSFIIPVFNIEGYLAGCLDSITRQAFGNIEIIAVDGASSDASGSILDEMSEKEPRLTVIHLDKPGPGRARNEGFKRARGDYVWFVDGDDLISADCLALIANRIEATPCDVLFINHQAFYSNGRTEPGDGHELMGWETAASFTLAEQPWVIDLGMASWKKIIRREFFVSADLEFLPDSPHEDIIVSCMLLMKASRLCVLNEVCYNYHKNRPGSAMATGDTKRHFRIFDAYETVLDEVEKRVGNGDRAVTVEIQHAFFQRAIWHYTTILDTGSYIARDDRRRFFGRIHSDYIRYRPAGYRRPTGLRGLKFFLIEKNAYPVYSVLGPVNKLRLRIGSTPGITRRPLLPARP
jgi:CDP-glycerol glycerophosphotransferase